MFYNSGVDLEGIYMQQIGDKYLKNYLDACVSKYNNFDFIQKDPISIPHKFSKLQDIEIMAFWTAMLSWGRRQTIIDKAGQLVQLMHGMPYQFIVEHTEKDRVAFLEFKHRTFQPTDTLYFLEFLQHFYRKHESLEKAFASHLSPGSETVEAALVGFHQDFFSLPYAPERTKKHVATPLRKSSCKRLNMFLRWMVRKDDRGVDFGVWDSIKPHQLLMPLDVHVGNTARALGLLKRKQSDWQATLELTEAVRAFDAADPVKYDFALFGIGMDESKSI